MYHGDDMDAEILELCRSGKKLEAVKLYKNITGENLKQSKEYVEKLASDHGIELSKGACFIATACYGDYDAYEVLLLRNYRDEKLLSTRSGRTFVKWYYRISPPIAKVLERSGWLRSFTKVVLSLIVYKLDCQVKQRNKKKHVEN